MTFDILSFLWGAIAGGALFFVIAVVIDLHTLMDLNDDR